MPIYKRPDTILTFNQRMICHVDDGVSSVILAQGWKKLSLPSPSRLQSALCNAFRSRLSTSLPRYSPLPLHLVAATSSLSGFGQTEVVESSFRMRWTDIVGVSLVMLQHHLRFVSQPNGREPEHEMSNLTTEIVSHSCVLSAGSHASISVPSSAIVWGQGGSEQNLDNIMPNPSDARLQHTHQKTLVGNVGATQILCKPLCLNRR